MRPAPNRSVSLLQTHTAPSKIILDGLGPSAEFDVGKSRLSLKSFVCEFESRDLMPTSTEPYALVVDDDAFILMDACHILEKAGFRFYEAGSGDEAKKLLSSYARSVTLLFSDVEMPGATDGFALARYVDEHWPWIEIVIASGRISPQEHDLPDKATFLESPSIIKWLSITFKRSFLTVRSLRN